MASPVARPAHPSRPQTPQKQAVGVNGDGGPRGKDRSGEGSLSSPEDACFQATAPSADHKMPSPVGSFPLDPRPRPPGRSQSQPRKTKRNQLLCIGGAMPMAISARHANGNLSAPSKWRSQRAKQMAISGRHALAIWSTRRAGVISASSTSATTSWPAHAYSACAIGRHPRRCQTACCPASRA